MATDKKERTVKIGIDFGTTNSFAGILHGDRVMPLVAGKESFGYPSVFYYDGKQELTGSIALKRADLHPENAVTSIKKKLTEQEIVLGGKAFTPKDIVTRIISYVINSAEEMLEQQYFISYDEMETVITVPVDFTNAEIEVIRRAAGDVKLKNGKRLQVIGVIAEPCAAAIEYFGMAKNSTIGTGALVYDLGGGTFDVALVQKTKNQAVPYEVVDQVGIHDLGGDDWDSVMEQLVQSKYKQEFNTKDVPTRIKKMIRANVRSWKEELTENQITTIYVDGEEEFETDVTRTEYEQATAKLMNQTLDAVQKMLKKHRDKIQQLVLTGGSSYMPQVMSRLKSIVPSEITIRIFEPEHAICYGAARYAASLEGPMSVPPIKTKAPHTYGVRYFSNKLEREIVHIFIRKGDVLPASGEMHARKQDASTSSYYAVFECDVDIDDKKKYFEILEGHEVMSVILERKMVVPVGTESVQKLTLTEDLKLIISASDPVNGVQVQDDTNVSIHGVNL